MTFVALMVRKAPLKSSGWWQQMCPKKAVHFFMGCLLCVNKKITANERPLEKKRKQLAQGVILLFRKSPFLPYFS